MNRNTGKFNAEYSNIPGRTNRPMQNRYANDRNMPSKQSYNTVSRQVNVSNSAHRPNVRVDSIRPIPRTPQVRYAQPTYNDRSVKSGSQTVKRPQSARHRPIKRRNTVLRDFLLGMAIGFVIFGTAAIFVVRAITDLFI